MTQNAYMRERIGQIEKTGSYFCIINAVLLLLISLMDYYLLDSPWLLLFRAAPLLTSIAFLAHVYLTRKRVSSLTLPLYILFLFSLVAMAVGVDVHLHFMESSPAHLHDAPMNGIILSLFIVYLVSAGARIWFPLFAGLPVGAGLAVLYLADVTHNEMVPHSLILITFIVLTVLSRVQERLVKREFDARALADEKMREAEREKEKFQQLFQFAPDAIFLQTLDGHIIDCNRRAEEISGYSRSELLDMNASDLVPERYKELIPEEVEELRSTGESFAIGTNIRKDGEEYPVEVSSRTITREGLAHALVIVRDITERVKDAEEIKKLSAAVEHSPASIIITTTTDGSILYTNPKFTEVTGYSREEVYGQNPRFLRSGVHSKEFYREMWETILSGEEWRGEFQNLTKSGEIYWESASIAPIVDESGEVAYFVAVKEDITEKKRREEEIHHLAMYDQLTSLANRTLFSDSIEKSIARARREGEELALLYVDLDKFKPVNDTYGHKAGDTLLKEIARRILEVVRKMDLAARLGGDEFAVLMQGYSQIEDVRKIAERLLSEIGKPIDIPPLQSQPQTRVEVGVSIGIALYPHDAEDEETLIARADEAMYGIKMEQKGGYRFYAELGKIFNE